VAPWIANRGEAALSGHGKASGSGCYRVDVVRERESTGTTFRMAGRLGQYGFRGIETRPGEPTDCWLYGPPLW
jgi:hypothetical protein